MSAKIEKDWTKRDWDWTKGTGTGLDGRKRIGDWTGLDWDWTGRDWDWTRRDWDWTKGTGTGLGGKAADPVSPAPVDLGS